MNILTALGLAALMVMAGFASTVTFYAASPGSKPLSAGPAYSALPDDDADSGKFLGVAGSGTLNNVPIICHIGVPAGETTFDLDIFDGDIGGHWDQWYDDYDFMDFKLYADPYKNGTGLQFLSKWDQFDMYDDDWYTKTFATSPAAMAPSGNYFYRLNVQWRNPGTSSSNNYFKIRTSGQISIAKDDQFAFMGAPMNVEFPEYGPSPWESQGYDPPVWAGDPDPDANNVDANSYDGDWRFYFYLPSETTLIEFTDGDSDFVNDASHGGSPQDGPSPYDGCNIPPNIYYYVKDPNGVSYYNYDPSGNLEWETFTITGSLPPGLWEMRFRGVDAHNMNFLEASHEIFSTPDPPLPVSPPPVVEPDQSSTVDPGVTKDYAHWIRNDGAPATFDLKASSSQGWTTRIYHDANGDGDLDPSEKSAGQIEDTGVLLKNAYFYIIVQVVVPSTASGKVDTTTVTASSQDEWNIQDSAYDTTTVVANTPPVADAGGPYNGFESISVALDGSGTYDPDGDALQYYWDLDNDGLYDDSTLVNPSYTWMEDGLYTVRLWVYDGEYFDTDITTVNIDNLAPEIDLKLEPPTKNTDEGSSVNLAAYARDWGSDDTILDFEFAWNDPKDPGATNSGVTPWNTLFSAMHTFYEDGTYHPLLTVTDSDGDTDTFQFTVNVGNVPPSVDCGTNRTIDEGTSLTITGTFSDPGAYDTHTGSWNWDDGTSNGGTVIEENSPPYATGTVTGTHTYLDDGTYNVILTVVDDDFGVGQDSVTVSVLDLAPIADFSWSPEFQDEGSLVSFTDLSTSYPDTIISWLWDFGDGDTSTLQNPGHAYGDNGDYTVSLTVTDDDGSMGVATYTVTIHNVPPVVEAGDDKVANEGSSISFLGSFTDPGWLDTHTILWDFGDGHTASGILSPTHAYGDNGIYTVTLTVTDDDGGVGVDTLEVEVKNVAPYVVGGPEQIIDEGTSASFLLATFTDPGWLDTHTAQIDWGDGNTEAGVVNESAGSGTVWGAHTYGDNGIFYVIIVVMDDDGAMDFARIKITVNNIAPAVSIGGPYVVDEGTSVTVGGHVTDPGSDDLTFTWSFDFGPAFTYVFYNDGSGPDPFPSPQINPVDMWDYAGHIYGDNGVFTVTLTVEDDDGGITIATTTVTVNNVAPAILPFAAPSPDENLAFTMDCSASDIGSDDLTFTWDWGDGTYDTATYYNDGTGPDPMPSPDINPFTTMDSTGHTYGDNGVFSVTLTVEDDDGGITVITTNVTVNNVAPTASAIEAYMFVNFTLRVAGEKWHSVGIILFEDGDEIWAATVTRQPGDPDEQSAQVTGVKIDMTKTYTAIVDYLPNDPRVNGNVWGGSPVWIDVDYQDGSRDRLHHTFNVRQSQWDTDHWNHIDPWEVEFAPHFGGHSITFEASATDPGSDDLTFNWDFGDGNLTGTTYFNDGMGPDPYPSPEINPMSATDSAAHCYAVSGIYTITVTVTDDDGGTATITLTLEVVVG